MKGYMNDLWSFSIVTRQWTWLSGMDTLNANGDYNKGSDGSRAPGSRYLHGMAINAAGDTIYVHGGEGYASSTTTGA
jgi:hypothetical protein